ncbi:MAG TPA: S9 family peptidase [Vicinamibacterales bacterium]|nr:S9 family peptidase [Vicinamibacterales bacterium]
MRPSRRLAPALAAAVAGVLVAAAASSVQPPARRLLAYDEVFAPPRDDVQPGEGVLDRLPTITGWLDDERYLELRRDADGERRLYAVRAADGRAELFRDYPAIRKALPSDVDPTRPAATTDDHRAAIYAKDGDLYYYEFAAGRLRRLTATAPPERNPRFSPDGRWVAYTRSNDLYVYDLENGLERQLTRDGGETVYNGWASWVYYEEILGRASQYAAFWWSPDSRRLAFMRFDDSPVPVFPIYHADGPYGELERQRYPKAGEANPYVRVGVVTVADGRTVWMDFDPKADHYLAWPFWTPDGRTLLVQWMNRAQDTIRFYHCDPETGRKTLVFEERQPSWVEFFETGDFHYLDGGARFLVRSDVDGWDHLYVHEPGGAAPRRLTAGEWRVMEILLVDERRGRVYFTARPPGRSWDQRLMRVALAGGEPETLTPEEGWHQVRLSPGGAYFVDTASTIATPPRMALHRGDGALVRRLGDARGARAAEVAWGRAELFTIPSGDGYDLPAYWVLPPDFDPGRRYPVIVSIYGGPDAGTVRNAWPGLQPHYWAQRGVVTVSVDHRGGGHFGKRGVAQMHRSLGRWEMHDLAAAARWLRGRPFIAGDRLCIAGNSYGGYTTLLALTRNAEYFACGQAGAPVTDWRLYDTVYTERYMDTPAENPEGYRDGAVLTWIERYRGGLRLTHGTVDDNVHMQNTLQVVDWLTRHDRRFELMIYPGSRHSVQAAQRAHANREAHDFWVRYLLGGRLPDRPTEAAQGR